MPPDAQPAAPAVPAVRGPDILVRTAPPLSATSDMPLAATAQPPPAASNSPTDQKAGTPPEISPETQAEAAKAKRGGESADDFLAGVAETGAAKRGDPGDSAKETKPDEDPELTAIEVDGKKIDEWSPSMKREMTRARNRQRAAEAEAKTLKETLSTLTKTVEELRVKVEPPKPEPTIPDAEPRPARDKFETPDAYDDALAAWGVREGERQAAKKTADDKAASAKKAADDAAADRQKAAETELANLNSVWIDRKAKAIEAMPDYVEVAERDDLTISLPMAHAILVADNGPQVAYHLGKHPEEAQRIAAISSPIVQAMEIGKIAARLAAPASRTPRAAPIQPLSGGNSPADTSTREPSMDEWAAKRTPEIMNTRKPFINAPPPGPARH